MEFYYTPNTCSLASLIVLYDVGASFDLKRLSFQTEDQKSDAYRAVKPKARVPALVIGGQALTETPAILAFLAQSNPGAGLIPDDAFAFARVQAFNSYLCSTLHVAHAHRMRGHRWADDEAAWKSMQAKVPQSVGDGFAYIEEHVFQGPFVFGGTYTIADPYLFTLAQWMEKDGVDPSRFPGVAGHRAMMRERPTVARALAVEQGGEA